MTQREDDQHSPSQTTQNTKRKRKRSSVSLEDSAQQQKRRKVDNLTQPEVDKNRNSKKRTRQAIEDPSKDHRTELFNTKTPKTTPEYNKRNKVWHDVRDSQAEKQEKKKR